MKTRELTIGATGTVTDLEGGGVVIVEGVSAGDDVDITWLDGNGAERGTVLMASPGRKYRPGFEFSGYKLSGTAGADVRLLVGPVTGDAVLFETTAFITNQAADPVPVEIITPVTLEASAVELLVSGDAVDSSNPLPVREQLPTAITNVAPVAATAVIAALLALDATRRGFLARNAGAEAVALVGLAGTFANAAIVLQPGETWREESAPGAAWYVICDAGLASSVNLLKW